MELISPYWINLKARYLELIRRLKLCRAILSGKPQANNYRVSIRRTGKDGFEFEAKGPSPNFVSQATDHFVETVSPKPKSDKEEATINANR